LEGSGRGFILRYYPCNLPGWAEENNEKIVRFQVLTAASTKFRVFWDVGPDDGGSAHL
jgi:hypothetical protein